MARWLRSIARYVPGPVAPGYPGLAGLALAWTAVGLVASLFVPMAYCRYGCPTGALLGYLRYNRRSDRLGAGDGVAALCLAVAVVLYVTA